MPVLNSAEEPGRFGSSHHLVPVHAPPPAGVGPTLNGVRGGLGGSDNIGWGRSSHTIPNPHLSPPKSALARYGALASSTYPRYEMLDRTFSPLSLNVAPSRKGGPSLRRLKYTSDPGSSFFAPNDQTPYLAAPTPSILRYGKPFDRTLHTPCPEPAEGPLPAPTSVCC